MCRGEKKKEQTKTMISGKSSTSVNIFLQLGSEYSGLTLLSDQKLFSLILSLCAK